MIKKKKSWNKNYNDSDIEFAMIKEKKKNLLTSADGAENLVKTKQFFFLWIK